MTLVESTAEVDTPVPLSNKVRPEGINVPVSTQSSQEKLESLKDDVW